MPRKKNISTLLFLASLFAANAQQLPTIDLHSTGRILYNPAAIGTRGEIELLLVNQQEWTTVSGHPAPIWIMGTMPVHREYEIQHGIVASTESEGNGIIRNTLVTYNFAYHIPMKDGREQKRLSFGLGLGYRNSGLNTSDLHFIESSDPLKKVNSYSSLLFTIGTHYHSPKWRAELSLYPAIEIPLGNSDLRIEYKPHFFGSAGYMIAMPVPYKTRVRIQASGRWIFGTLPEARGDLSAGKPAKFWIGLIGTQSGVGIYGQIYFLKNFQFGTSAFSRFAFYGRNFYSLGFYLSYTIKHTSFFPSQIWE